MKASIEQLKYRHIFTLMFRCFFIMFVLFIKLSLSQLQMEIQVFTKSQDSTTTEFSSALVLGKKSHPKQGGQIVRLSFSYGNSGYSILGYLQMFEVRIIDVAVLCENTHLKHFVLGGSTGPAKVSRVHCRSRPSLPVLVS